MGLIYIIVFHYWWFNINYIDYIEVVYWLNIINYINYNITIYIYNMMKNSNKIGS